MDCDVSQVEEAVVVGVVCVHSRSSCSWSNVHVGNLRDDRFRVEFYIYAKCLPLSSIKVGVRIGSRFYNCFKLVDKVSARLWNLCNRKITSLLIVTLLNLDPTMKSTYIVASVMLPSYVSGIEVVI